MHNLLFAFALSVSGLGLTAQTTWQVGTPALPDIDAAMAVAAPGDILDVPMGWYPAFTATKGVTIRGVGLSQVHGQLSGNAPVVCDIPAGQELHIKWMGFYQNSVEVRGGRVTLAHCTILPDNGCSALSAANASVHLVGCNLFGSYAPVLMALASDVTAVGGAFDMSWGGPPIAGNVSLDQSRFHATGVSMRRGQFGPTCPAVGAINGSIAWLSDSLLESYTCAIDSVGSSVRTDRCTVLEGGAACSAGVPGTLLGVEPVSAQVGFGPGLTWEPAFHYEPNSFVILFASPRLDTVSWGPFMEQPTWLHHPQGFAAQVLFTDAAGQAQASITFPSGPGIANQRLWFVGIAGPGQQLQVSPVLGGVL